MKVIRSKDSRCNMTKIRIYPISKSQTEKLLENRLSLCFRVFQIFFTLYCLVSTKRSHIFKQTFSWKLKVFLRSCTKGWTPCTKGWNFLESLLSLLCIHLYIDNIAIQINPENPHCFQLLVTKSVPTDSTLNKLLVI